MLSIPPPPSAGFREYPLDGAMLYFHPPTGTHVRIRTAATRHLRRQAPRVAMFGITNACNLRCDFCSRDVSRGSRWTVASAASALRGLAAAGTLEVAFGGGEPLLFPGFVALLEELRETTPLAMHLTTNGTLVRESSWRRLRGLVGMARLSIYEGTRWRDAADVLAGCDQRWGANVLVDDDALASVPALLDELAARRCHDVSLLSYVGPDRRRRLGTTGERRLAEMLAASPVPARLSVCFGPRVPAPRLFTGLDHDAHGAGDCGAGYDFVSITPDQRVQACSFSDDSLPGATAEEVLHAWRMHAVRLAQPSPRDGCARQLPLISTAPALPPIAVWQAFSGNNSGESVLVARFQTIGDAEAFVAELIPGWVPDEPYSDLWRKLFTEAEVATPAMTQGPDTVPPPGPQELVAIGATVLALGYAADDAFPELRAFAWRRRAYEVRGGVHVHDPLSLITVVRCADAADARRVQRSALDAGARAYLHGDLVLVIPAWQDGLVAVRDELVSLAGGRPFSVEIYEGEVAEPDLTGVLQRLGAELAAHPRLLVMFPWWNAQTLGNARALATSVREARACIAGNAVLFDDIQRPRHVALMAYRRGGDVSLLSSRVVDVRGTLWFERPRHQKGRRSEPPVLEPGGFEAALRGVLSAEAITVRPSWRGVVASVHTADPARAMRVLEHEATQRGCNVHLSIRDLDPLAWTVRRLIADCRRAR